MLTLLDPVLFTASQHISRRLKVKILLFMTLYNPYLFEFLRSHFKCKWWVNNITSDLEQNWISHRTKERSNTRKQNPLLYLKHQKNKKNKTKKLSKLCLQLCITKNLQLVYGRPISTYFNILLPYLKCILSVIQAINPYVIIQSCAWDGPKNSQLEPLGGGFANRLTHQAVSPQCLCQNMTCLRVHLHIAGGGEVLLSHYNHILLDPNTLKSHS